MDTINLEKRIIYVSGLPRAGSTLLCQLFGQHPQVYSPGHSSPLCNTLGSLRSNLSDNPFWLSQLDVDAGLAHTRLLNACRGFINGWFAETPRGVVVDKNRNWLRMVDTVNLLDPTWRMVVCIRDLCQVYGSVEDQHQRTLLFDFPDHLDSDSAYVRADKMFADDGVIGEPLRSIEYFLNDVTGPAFQERVRFLPFEALVANPVEEMRALYGWLELPDAPFDPQRLTVREHESDSHYRWKYRHDTRPAIQPPGPHKISPRIEADILKNFGWFFAEFYAG